MSAFSACPLDTLSDRFHHPMPALFCVSSQVRATKSCPKLFCSFDLLGGWVRFAKTAALIVLEVDCTQENDAQPGASIDHFMPLVRSPPARNTTFDGEIRPIDPALATRITVASFGAFLIVRNVAAKLRDGLSALCSRTARAHDPVSYASTFARCQLNKDIEFILMLRAIGQSLVGDGRVTIPLAVGRTGRDRRAVDHHVRPGID
jgi:hypothetical protein